MSKGGNLPCGIEDVVELTGIHVVRNTGTQLHCRCPFCGDTKAHLNVKPEKNVFRCNRCGKGGGVLHLYAAVNEISLSTAYEELCRLFPGDGSGRGRKSRGNGSARVVIPESPLADAAVRDSTYSSLLSMLSLGARHRESLLRRGLSGDDILRLGYRTTPAVRSAKIVTELLERGCTLRGVPGFYMDRETGMWKLDIRASGIMIPDRNCRGEIEAIQIRLDDGFGSKYNLLTSTDRYYGTPAACCPHFTGFTEDTEQVILTEGVLKADVARCISQALGKPAAFVGLTGVGNSGQYERALRELRTRGIAKITVAFDMDAFTNENVRRARDRVIQKGSGEGFDMTPLRWDPRFKGIDDLLLSFRER